MSEPDVDGALGAVVEGATVASAADEARKRHGVLRSLQPHVWAAQGRCPNCGGPGDGAYCPDCGQSQSEVHKPIANLIWDAMGGLFALDGRFWRTAPPLVFQPGRITALYLSGARATFVQPFRLFLFATIAVFLVASALTGDGRDLVATSAVSAPSTGADAGGEAAAASGGPRTEEPTTENSPGVQVEVVTPSEFYRNLGDGNHDGRADTAERDGLKCAIRAFLVPEQEASPHCVALESREDRSVNVQLGGAVAPGPLALRMRLADNLNLAVDRPDAYIAALKRWAPRIMLAMFPVYALLLALMYFWRRDLLFYDHVVFSLHFHTALFILMMVTYVVSLVLGSWSLALFFVWGHVILYKMQRQAYGASPTLAVMRIIFLNLLYTIVLACATALLMVFGVVFI